MTLTYRTALCQSRQAPFLPWVLMLVSTFIGGRPVVDMLGIGAGHMYYFLADVYPGAS